MRDERSDEGARSGLWDDRACIAEIRRGNPAAFENLFRTHAQALFRIAYRYVRSADVADDILQDVMLSVWKNREHWEITGTVQAYLHAATRKRALKVLLTEGRTQKHEDAFALEDDAPGMGHHADQPDIQAETHELTAAIADAVATLPERYRRVLMLRAAEHMTYPEIAALLGLPLKTVETRARRGFERLQSVLKPYFRKS